MTDKNRRRILKKKKKSRIYECSELEIFTRRFLMRRNSLLLEKEASLQVCEEEGKATVGHNIELTSILGEGYNSGEIDLGRLDLQSLFSNN